MNKLWVVGLVMLLAGCTYEGKSLESYLEEPESIIKDPHYGEYQAKLDALESQYLHKEISYAEYVGKKKELEDIYTKEVRDRNDVISPSEFDIHQP